MLLVVVQVIDHLEEEKARGQLCVSVRLKAEEAAPGGHEAVTALEWGHLEDLSGYFMNCRTEDVVLKGVLGSFYPTETTAGGAVLEPPGSGPAIQEGSDEHHSNSGRCYLPRSL